MPSSVFDEFAQWKKLHWINERWSSRCKVWSKTTDCISSLYFVVTKEDGEKRLQGHNFMKVYMTLYLQDKNCVKQLREKKTCKEKPSLDSKESRRQRKLWFAKEVTWRNTCFRYFITKCVILSAKEVTGISERTGNQDHLSSTCRSEFRLLFQGRFFFGRFFAKGQSLRSHNTKHINESRKKTDANTMAWQELSTELSIIERQVNTRDACMQVLQKRGIQEFLCIKKTAGICVAQKAKLKEMQVTISVSDWLECKNKASVSWMLF